MSIEIKIYEEILSIINEKNEIIIIDNIQYHLSDIVENEQLLIKLNNEIINNFKKLPLRNKLQLYTNIVHGTKFDFLNY